MASSVLLVSNHDAHADDSEVEFEVLSSYDIVDSQWAELYVLDVDSEIALGVVLEIDQLAPASEDETRHLLLDHLESSALLREAYFIAGSMLNDPLLRERIASGELQDTLIDRVSGDAGEYGTMSARLINPTLMSARDLFHARFASDWDSYDDWMEDVREAEQREQDERAREEAARRDAERSQRRADEASGFGTFIGVLCWGGTAAGGVIVCGKSSVPTAGQSLGWCAAGASGATAAAYAGCKGGVDWATGVGRHTDAAEEARRDEAAARARAEAAAAEAQRSRRRAERARERAMAEFNACIEAGGEANACAAEHLATNDGDGDSDDGYADAEEGDENEGGDSSACLEEDADGDDACHPDDDAGSDADESTPPSEEDEDDDAGRPNPMDTPTCTAECRARGEAWLEDRQREREDSLINWGPDGRPESTISEQELRRALGMTDEDDPCDPRLASCHHRASTYSDLGFSPLRRDIDWGPDGPPDAGGGTPPPGAPRAPLRQRGAR